MCTCLLCRITMSETASPVGIAFDLQRSAIEQTRDAVVRGVEAQQAFGEAVVDFDSAREVNERSFEALSTFVDVYFDAVGAAAPGGQELVADYRAAVDDQIETLETNQVDALETFEANVREGSEAADELTEEFLATLDEQFEAVLAAHEDAEAETVEALDEVEDAVDEVFEEFDALSEEFAAAFEDAIEQSVAQFETGATAVGEQVADANAELAATAQKQVSAQVEAADESLQAIDGLGSTYAGRLREAGVDSIAALADANAALVADVADVSETQAEKWIDAARQSA